MKPITEKEFVQLISFIKAGYGINLTQKKALVLGRLQNYLVQNKFASFSEYFEYVLTDRTQLAAAELINRITTNHTYFMREPAHFIFFENTILPYLYSRQTAERDIRIWSAGCSTGEEPYTIAMIIDSFFGETKKMWDTKILATDVSTKVLEFAQQGIYLNENIEKLNPIWKYNYFSKIGNEKFSISSKIKNEVLFRKFNLMEEIFPFKKKFNVIFCRNVMIYFDNDTKENLINKFYNSLDNGGYLIIGHTESINRDKTKFKYIMPAVYKKE